MFINEVWIFQILTEEIINHSVKISLTSFKILSSFLSKINDSCRVKGQFDKVIHTGFFFFWNAIIYQFFMHLSILNELIFNFIRPEIFANIFCNFLFSLISIIIWRNILICDICLHIWIVISFIDSLKDTHVIIKIFDSEFP